MSAKISRHAKESLVISVVADASTGVSLLYLHHCIVDNCSLPFCCTCQLFISLWDVFAGEDDKGWDEDRVRVIPTPWGAPANITALPTPAINPSFSSRTWIDTFDCAPHALCSVKCMHLHCHSMEDLQSVRLVENSTHSLDKHPSSDGICFL